MFAQLPFSKAARAALTARSTSSLSHSATLASTLPVAGLMLSKVLPEAAGTYLPLMKAWLRYWRPAACACRESRDKAADIAGAPEWGIEEAGTLATRMHGCNIPHKWGCPRPLKC